MKIKKLPSDARKPLIRVVEEGKAVWVVGAGFRKQPVWVQRIYEGDKNG